MNIQKLGQGEAKIAIVARLHEDEINGVEVVRQFLRSVSQERLSLKLVERIRRKSG